MENNLTHTNSNEQDLFNEIAALVEQSKQQIAVQVNSSLTLLFWHVGNRINEFVLQNERAEYGKQIVVTLSRQLVEHYGRNFEERNLRRMLQFCEQFSDFSIVSTLSTQLSWSHFITLLPLKKQEAKLFYANKIAEERWSVRNLRKQIETKAYERTLVANTQLPVQIEDTQNLFKDPYLLDFLKLKDDYLEKNLEEAILYLMKFLYEKILSSNCF